ncbi:hypothetical protein ACIQ1H_05155 [Lysinibacillus sp. NPDC097279]
MEHKSINELSVEEILRQQLVLLAERSQSALDEELARLTNSMIEIANYLE